MSFVTFIVVDKDGKQIDQYTDKSCRIMQRCDLRGGPWKRVRHMGHDYTVQTDSTGRHYIRIGDHIKGRRK